MQVLSKRDVGLVMIGVNVPMACYFAYSVIGEVRSQIRTMVNTLLVDQAPKSHETANPTFEIDA